MPRKHTDHSKSAPAAEGSATWTQPDGQYQNQPNMGLIHSQQKHDWELTVDHHRHSSLTNSGLKWN